MNSATEIMRDDVAVALTDTLARERHLGRVYRQQTDAAWSPRVRRLWEEGWAVKRGHDEALTRLLVAAGGARAADETAPAPLPARREVLSWLYEQERVLALRYLDFARDADSDAHRVFSRLADEQERLLARVRQTYRDYSTA